MSKYSGIGQVSSDEFKFPIQRKNDQVPVQNLALSLRSKIYPPARIGHNEMQQYSTSHEELQSKTQSDDLYKLCNSFRTKPQLKELSAISNTEYLPYNKTNCCLCLNEVTDDVHINLTCTHLAHTSCLVLKEGKGFKFPLCKFCKREILPKDRHDGLMKSRWLI